MKKFQLPKITLKGKAKRIVVKAKIKSPTIMIVAGVAGVVGGTVMACRATMKLKPILDEGKEATNDIHEYASSDEAKEKGYTEKEETKAIFKPENIIGQLVNADASWNRLFDVPHRKFLRMYIVYHLNVSSIRQDSKRLDTIVIDNDLMRRMNMTEDDLYSAAVINMGKPYIANTAEFLQLDPDVYDSVGDNLLIISNTNLIYGAFAITQDTVLASVSKRIGGDFVILPGSVNEMYAVKLYSNMNMDEIQSWANEVSHILKDETEFITTDVYIYRSKSHIIESVPGGQEWQL